MIRYLVILSAMPPAHIYLECWVAPVHPVAAHCTCRSHKEKLTDAGVSGPERKALVRPAEERC